MAVAVLRTRRLTLRPLVAADLDLFVEEGGGVSNEARRWAIAAANLDPLTAGAWTLVHRLSGRVVGLFVYFRADEGEGAEIGYMVAARWRARGLGAEAVVAAVGHMVETLGHHRVFADVALSNGASQKVLARMGFVRVPASEGDVTVGVGRQRASRWMLTPATRLHAA